MSDAGADGAAIDPPAASPPVSPRLAAQTVLANLFLDTWYNNHDIRWIAGGLRATGLSVAELEQILRRDVAPAFAGNLIALAGEWQPWSADEVAQIMTRRPPLSGLLGRAGWRMVRADWTRVRALLAD